MRTTTEIEKEYGRWLEVATETEIRNELRMMRPEQIEDAFFQDLEFGTGGLRGVLGAGTNRMNVYTVEKATKGLAAYLSETLEGRTAVVIGYDSRINSDLFAKTAARVLVSRGVHVYLWPEPLPVPTVSFAVRYYHASAGIMITASHNPAKYNGYKVYGADGCQITTKAAAMILECIQSEEIFELNELPSFETIQSTGLFEYISTDVLTGFIEEVKNQSVLFGDEVDREVAVVYSPLNGTGLVPVTKVLKETGFSNITIVEEQRLPDGNFPTCPFPNPEIREAMDLGLKYAEQTNADLLIATDPDCDRCGIAVRTTCGDYQLLSGNEVGLLLLDFICSQRSNHGKMPEHPVFIKTIVTTDLAEKIAARYGVKTVNVLTGFKYIGEKIGELEKDGKACSFVFGFEESYGYLSGTYVRDKDGVNAAFLICEMFAYYRTHGISLVDKLNEIYSQYGYCLNTLHSIELLGPSGMKKIQSIMCRLRKGLTNLAGFPVIKIEDYGAGLNGLPKSNVLKFFFEDRKFSGFVVVRPSGTEPKLKVYTSVSTGDERIAIKVEKDLMESLQIYFEDIGQS